MNRAPLLIALLVPLAAAQSTLPAPEPNEAPPCDLPAAVRFAQAEVGFENLAFDGNGNLWLTAFGDGLYRAFPNGTVSFVASDERPSTAAGPLDTPNAFMGIDIGPDGALYVAEGLSIAQPVPARVLRFPVPGDATFEVYAEGMDGANGLAVTPDGVVYVAHGFRDEIWRIPRPGVVELWTQVTTVNGVVEHPDGERLVVAQVVGEGTVATAIRFDDPASREVLVQFNPVGGPIHAKGIDDLVVAQEGVIFGAAHLRGQVLRGDPATGDICVAMDFTQLGGRGGAPTSVRIAQGFGAWDGWLFSVDSGGDIWAQDLGTNSSVAGTGDGQTTSQPSDARVPAPPIALLLLLVAIAAGMARMRA